MKHMNNHFGKSRIPMNLQFFAESGAGNGEGNGGDNGDGGNVSGDNKPTYEQLIEELARARTEASQANADKERFKNSVDKLTRQNGELTNQVRERMSADEKAAAEKAEAEAAKDAKIQELEAKFRHMDYTKRFMGVGMDETSATELAGLTGEIAEPEKFFSALDKFVKATIKKAGEDSVETFIKSNPSIKAGNGSGDQYDEAVEIARESAKRKRNNGFNEEALKQWM